MAMRLASSGAQLWRRGRCDALGFHASPLANRHRTQDAAVLVGKAADPAGAGATVDMWATISQEDTGNGS